jgi:hypothetical protein
MDRGGLKMIDIKNLLLVIALASAMGCDEGYDTAELVGRPFFTIAYCEAEVDGVGIVDVETDYLPHVICCENGNADFEALKAQAVAARSFLYYKLDTSGSIGDGTGDQVYTCGTEPESQHYEAVAETSGEVLTYEDVTICSFYVAGAVPSADDCVALPSDDDYSNTEQYVTYNYNLSGDDVNQTSLGWIDPGNVYNRGCKSQNGAHCLSENGWIYDDILSFYYGMDIIIDVADGECIESPDPDAGTDTDTDSDTDSDYEGDDDDDDCLGDSSDSCSLVPHQEVTKSLIGLIFGF